MSVKFWCTVGDRIGRIIERAAEHDGINRTAKAGQLLDSAVRSCLQSGEYPQTWGDEAGDEVVVAEEAIALDLIREIAQGEPLDPGKVAAIAKLLDIAPHDLEAKLYKENGHAKATR